MGALHCAKAKANATAKPRVKAMPKPQKKVPGLNYGMNKWSSSKELLAFISLSCQAATAAPATEPATAVDTEALQASAPEPTDGATMATKAWNVLLGAIWHGHCRHCANCF